MIVFEDEYCKFPGSKFTRSFASIDNNFVVLVLVCGLVVERY